MIVVDASAIVALVRRDEPVADDLARILAMSVRRLHAPHLLDLEVASALRKVVLRGSVSGRRATQALHDFEQLPIVRWEHRALLERVWALRDTLTAYDAAYVALAEALGARLLTLDVRLGRAAAPTVEVVALR